MGQEWFGENFISRSQAVAHRLNYAATSGRTRTTPKSCLHTLNPQCWQNPGTESRKFQLALAMEKPARGVTDKFNYKQVQLTEFGVNVHRTFLVANKQTGENNENANGARSKPEGIIASVGNPRLQPEVF
ncbi:hypothetical protein CBL_08671 [Carabus blaptoides fortunei]